MFEQAIAEFQSATAKSNRDPMALASLGHVYAVSGNRREAERVLDELRTMSKQRYVSPYNLALIYAGLGMKEESLTWLEKSYEVRDYRMIWLKVEPQFDSLRSDQGFIALLQRMRLPPVE